MNGWSLEEEPYRTSNIKRQGLVDQRGLYSNYHVLSQVILELLYFYTSYERRHSRLLTMLKTMQIQLDNFAGTLYLHDLPSEAVHSSRTTTGLLRMMMRME
jgi:hypothetical protein